MGASTLQCPPAAAVAMRFAPTDNPEVMLITPEARADERGFFMETYHTASFAGAGIHASIERADAVIAISEFTRQSLSDRMRMAAGCPVACSDRAALPEIAGEAALYFDPTDVEAIASAMRRLCDEGDLRKRLVQLGHARAKLYDWRTAATQTVEVYRSVVPV